MSAFCCEANAHCSCPQTELCSGSLYTLLAVCSTLPAKTRSGSRPSLSLQINNFACAGALRKQRCRSHRAWPPNMQCFTNHTAYIQRTASLSICIFLISDPRLFVNIQSSFARFSPLLSIAFLEFRAGKGNSPWAQFNKHSFLNLNSWVILLKRW